jgi:hypothetical protein
VVVSAGRVFALCVVCVEPVQALLPVTQLIVLSAPTRAHHARNE